jgi:hypothetical protein
MNWYKVSSYSMLGILGGFLTAVGLPFTNWRYWPILLLTLVYGQLCKLEDHRG